MKQILILAALLLSINFANAKAAKCPEGSKTILTCEALSDSYVASAVVCLDQNKKISVQLELKGTGTLAILENATESYAYGSATYKGPDYTLYTFPSEAYENGLLEIQGQPSVSLSCH